MRAGLLRQFITVEQDVGTTVTGAGQPIKEWQVFCERHAHVKELQGRELFSSQQKWPEVDTTVVLRGDADTVAITSKMRVRYTNRFLQEKILNILIPMDDDGCGVTILLQCRKEG